MIQCIGVGLATERVRAVGVRGRCVRWAMEAEIKGDDDIGQTIADLLATAPLPRARRSRVRVALGPSWAQVKLLRGLPPLTSSRAVASLVQESATRFFLSDRRPLVTTGVRLVRPGEVWAGALDQHVVRQVEAACRGLRVRLDAFVPTAVTLGHALGSEQVRWPDGEFLLETRQVNGELTSVRRYRALDAGPVQVTPPIIEALASLGTDGWRYADAYGAAILSPGEPLALRPGRRALPETVPLWRLIAASTACTIALLGSLLLPAVIARTSAMAAEARIGAIDQERRLALQAEAELARVTDALGEILTFERSRRSATVLLADFARTLPDSSAILLIRVDTAAGNLVTVAPRAMAVLEPVERLPTIAAPHIVGPVLRERVGEREMERVTIRFQLRDISPRAEDITESPTNESR